MAEILTLSREQIRGAARPRATDDATHRTAEVIVFPRMSVSHLLGIWEALHNGAPRGTKADPSSPHLTAPPVW
jgi:hypothetical protein